jgi:Cu-Zn family superoxide dismutase
MINVAIALGLLGSIFVGAAVSAAEIKAEIFSATKAGAGKKVGYVTFEDTRYGLVIKPNLKGLAGGAHGLHIHELANCAPLKTKHTIIPAGKAGGHFDPLKTGRHRGPYGDGHAGDLPNLIVEPDGTASIPVLAPRLKISDIKNRSLMLHYGPDRYEGHAHHHHGKGGMRMYCGIIK